MCGDIERTLQCIDQLHHNASDKSRTVAYRDVLGCAISDAFLSIRKELGWNLPMSNVDAKRMLKRPFKCWLSDTTISAIGTVITDIIKAA